MLHPLPAAGAAELHAGHAAPGGAAGTSASPLAAVHCAPASRLCQASGCSSPLAALRASPALRLSSSLSLNFQVQNQHQWCRPASVLQGAHCFGGEQTCEPPMSGSAASISGNMRCDISILLHPMQERAFPDKSSDVNCLMGCSSSFGRQSWVRCTSFECGQCHCFALTLRNMLPEFSGKLDHLQH